MHNVPDRVRENPAAARRKKRSQPKVQRHRRLRVQNHQNTWLPRPVPWTVGSHLWLNTQIGREIWRLRVSEKPTRGLRWKTECRESAVGRSLRRGLRSHPRGHAHGDYQSQVRQRPKIRQTSIQGILSRD